VTAPSQPPLESKGIQSYVSIVLSALSRFFLSGNSSLTGSGLDVWVWARAIVCTALLSCAINTWLLRSVDQSYYRATLPAINNAKSTEEAVAAAIQLCGAEAGAAEQDYVQEAFRQRTANKPCREYLLDLIRAMHGTVSPDLERALDRQMTGDRRGFRCYAIRSSGVSGKKTVEALRRIDPHWNRKTSVLEESAARMQSGEAEAFLEKFIDRVAQETRGAQRNLMRYNGWIQWWTICVCWVVLLLAFNRAALLARLVRDGWFPHRQRTPLVERLAACDGSPPAPLPNSATTFAAAQPIEPLLDRQVYPTYEFLIGLLPSLGFIGTVLGMGDALLTADSLFSANDKNQAISNITSHLGFAFDTTLVGLVTGILAGSVMLQLRLWETSLWQAATMNSLPAARPPHVGIDPVRAL
jgi:hypothetical protein